MVTGKNKDQFEKWLNKEFGWYATIHDFYDYDFRLQIGVYLSYYDSLDIDISVNKCICLDTFYDFHIFNKCETVICYEDDHVTREVAYKEAFKKADESVNN